MLHWTPGARPEDGIWAKYWYHNLHKSSGFARYHPKKIPVPDHIWPLYEECQAIYDRLLKYALR
jgi:hypothetical protein